MRHDDVPAGRGARVLQPLHRRKLLYVGWSQRGDGGLRRRHVCRGIGHGVHTLRAGHFRGGHNVRGLCSLRWGLCRKRQGFLNLHPMRESELVHSWDMFERTYRVGLLSVQKGLVHGG